MPLPSSGQIAASQINTELGRSSTAQMSIVSARNGSYATINDASGFRPTAGPNYGYAYSDWYGYCQGCVYPVIFTELYEPYVGINVRYYAYNAYGVEVINEFWYYSNTTGANLSNDTGVTIRTNYSIQVLWNPDYWGSGSIYKQVFNTTDGYLLNVYEDAYSARIFTFTTGSFFTAKGAVYYVNASPNSL